MTSRNMYRILKYLFRNSSRRTHQRLLNALPAGVLRFDLASHFRELHKQKQKL